MKTKVSSQIAEALARHAVTSPAIVAESKAALVAVPASPPPLAPEEPTYPCTAPHKCGCKGTLGQMCNPRVDLAGIRIMDRDIAPLPLAVVATLVCAEWATAQNTSGIPFGEIGATFFHASQTATAWAARKVARLVGIANETARRKRQLEAYTAYWLALVALRGEPATAVKVGSKMIPLPTPHVKGKAPVCGIPHMALGDRKQACNGQLKVTIVDSEDSTTSERYYVALVCRPVSVVLNGLANDALAAKCDVEPFWSAVDQSLADQRIVIKRRRAPLTAAQLARQVGGESVRPAGGLKSIPLEHRSVPRQPTPAPTTPESGASSADAPPQPTPPKKSRAAKKEARRLAAAEKLLAPPEPTPMKVDDIGLTDEPEFPASLSGMEDYARRAQRFANGEKARIWRTAELVADFPHLGESMDGVIELMSIIEAEEKLRGQAQEIRSTPALATIAEEFGADIAKPADVAFVFAENVRRTMVGAKDRMIKGASAKDVVPAYSKRSRG